MGHFEDESFQAITCTGTDNSKQTKPQTKPKPAVPRPVRTVHMCVLMTMYNCGTQYSTEQ